MSPKFPVSGDLDETDAGIRIIALIVAAVYLAIRGAGRGIGSAESEAAAINDVAKTAVEFEKYIKNG